MPQPTPRRRPKQLSLDSLPAYIPNHPPDDPPPPDYPDSADDADNEDPAQLNYPPRSPTSPPLSPRRRPRPSSRRPSSRRSIYSSSKSASSDTYLDSLLERSVRALEMSNAILQSAAPSPMPFQQQHPHSLNMENVIDNALHWQAHALDKRIRGTRDVMDELDDLVASVNDFIGEPSTSHYPISSSLPTSSASNAMRYPRRLSIDDRNMQDGPRLRYASDERAHRAPPPRAITQYVSVGSSNGDEEESQDGGQEVVVLPPTLGQNVSPILSPLPSRPKPRPYSHDFSPHAESRSPQAREYLSHVIHAITPPSPSTPPPLSRSLSDSARSSTTRPIETPSRDSSRSRRSSSPRRSLDKRPMTPPVEVSTPPSSSESSLGAPQTMERLRKILECTASPSSPADSNKTKGRLQPPALILKGRGAPLEAQEVSTTASISRLFTKSTHHSSTTAPSPKQSSLKQPSSPLLSAGQLTPASGPSSGRTTPRFKVQFADLPEPYSSSKRGSKSKPKKATSENSWWSNFWTTESLSTLKKNDDRSEDKLVRGWGRPSFGSSTLDDWTV